MGFGLLFAVAVTLASVPVDHVYGGAAGSVQSDLERGGGALPFTGTDLALLVTGGLMLLVVGAVLRRAARRSG